MDRFIYLDFSLAPENAFIWKTSTIFQVKFWNLLKWYFCIGCMPQVLNKRNHSKIYLQWLFQCLIVYFDYIWVYLFADEMLFCYEILDVKTELVI